MTSVHNLIVGTMYLWLEGEAMCKNEMTGHQAIINLKSKGFAFWKSDDYYNEG